MNSIRNKVEWLVSLVTSDLDILMILEIKIDESFPLSLFNIDGLYIPYSHDSNAHGGGILMHFRNNITAKLLKLENLPSDIEAFLYKLISKVKNGYSFVHITPISL